MNRPVRILTALLLAGSASLATAQYNAQANNLAGSAGLNNGMPELPAIEPVPPLTNSSPMTPNLPFANCDTAGCWGVDGTRYTRAGNTLFGSNGKVCSITAPGAPAVCN